MYIRKEDLILVILFVIVFPAFLIGVIPRNNKQDQRENNTSTNIAEPEQTEMPSDDNELMIQVLIGEEVKAMALETYVTGVVLAEMPAAFDEEALKAQAVAARTYTLRRVEQNIKHDTANVCTQSACCQAFCSWPDFLSRKGSMAELNRVIQAVEKTKGEVLLYGGELIEATYFSCSGGSTEDAVAVWGESIPYLQAVDSPGEENATHFSDTVSFTAEDFASKLNIVLTGLPTQWVTDPVYTRGGGVERITICGYTFTGLEIRSLLSLRSTSFSISVVGDLVNISTKGYGHRVGLSQYGAEAMAISGYDYKEILQHYYQNTLLSDYDERSSKD